MLRLAIAVAVVSLLLAVALVGMRIIRTVTGGANSVPPEPVRITRATLRPSSELDVHAQFDRCLTPAGSRVEWHGDVAHVTVLAEQGKSRQPCRPPSEELVTIDLSRRPSQVVDAGCVLAGMPEADCRVIG